jgi:hypothetical protein
MKTTIGKFDPATGTVNVTFRHGNVTHRRPVNACTLPDGSYDAVGTRARVAEVAQGVEKKIDQGLITMPAPAPATTPAPAAEPETPSEPA